MPVSRSARLLAALALPLLVAACSVSGGPAAVDTPSPSASAHATAGASRGPASSGAAATALGSPGATPASSAMLGPTTGTLTLVEPARDLSSSQGSVTLTPPGSLAMLQAGADGRLHTLACAVGCGDPAVWSDTVLDPGVGWANPMIRSLDDGSLVAVMDGTGSAQGSEVIGECASACDSAASWRWSRLPLPSDATALRSPSRYFAVGGGDMIIGLGSGSPMSALVCVGACESQTGWTRIEFSSSTCGAPSVAVGPDGAMAFACATGGTGDGASENVEVWSCPGACAVQANWGGVTGLAIGGGLAVDVTVGPEGMVGAAVNLGQQANPSMAGHLGWFQCARGCADAAAWHGIVVGPEALYAPHVAAVTDQQGRSLVAYNASSSSGTGLLTSACAADCLKSASWSVALLDDATRVASQIMVSPPPGCTAVAWTPDDVMDITLRGDWGAIASAYGATGTGGSCPAGSPAPSAAASPIRSVVSLAVLGP